MAQITPLIPFRSKDCSDWDKSEAIGEKRRTYPADILIELAYASGMNTGPVATIHTANIVRNWQALASLHADAETAAVVKANAYGHGLEPVATALAAAGCRTFFVAYAAEGIALRNILGNGPDIHVFHGPGPDEIMPARSARLTPVLNTFAQIRQWRESGPEDSTPVTLHFDTGMNRLGLKPEDSSEICDLVSDIPIGLVMSHLACADTPAHPMNRQQYDAFTAVSENWPDVSRSLASTAGLYLGTAYGLDLTRPGIGLYGGGPAPPAGTQLRPGLTLEAPIISVFEVGPGAATGYGATRYFDTSRTLATVALGYADGYPRSAANSGFAMYEGTALPVAGRISMDLTTLDITEKRDDISAGTMVEFIGAQAHLETQAAAAGTLGYELITGIGHRVRRRITS